MECICDSLRPGTQYKLRVACASSAGVSEYSDICHIQTEPVSPGQCAPPRPHGKPKATSLHLKWGWPETDGGSEVTEFEVDMTSPDNQTRQVYRGHDTECVVASLLPGRPYLFQVRAHNRAGAGRWSDSLEVVSGAGAPDPPSAPFAEIRSATVVHLKWECPINNGAIISEYNLQMAILESHKCVSPIVSPSHTSHHSKSSSATSSSDENEDSDEEEDESLDSEHEDDEDESLNKRKVRMVKRKRRAHSNEGLDSDSEDDIEELNDDRVEPPANVSHEEEVKSELEPPEFVTIYNGNQSSFEARNLDPATTYMFRVCASNAAGSSGWSSSTKVDTPASPPAPVNAVQLLSSTASSLTVGWSRPVANGEIVTHYNVDCAGVGSVTTTDTKRTIERLRPDTVYTVRVQAANRIGLGPFTNPPCKFSTRPLPPAPPRCECVNANHNSLKLKWGDAKSNSQELCHYSLDMENSRNQ